MKVALAQYDVSRGDCARNLDTITKLANQAVEGGANLLCLPEMATTGFDWDENRRLLPEAEKHLDALTRMASSYRVDICGSFLEKTESGSAANTFHYIDSSGHLLAKYRKIHLFTLFREDEHVQAGHQPVVVDTKYAHAGLSICYDLRFPELFRRNAELGAEIQILPAAFPHPRLEHWRTLVRARAIENQCYFIATNQCGAEGHGGGVGETQYFGHSMVVNPWGEIVLEAGEDEGLFHCELDLSLVKETRAKLTALKDRRLDIF